MPNLMIKITGINGNVVYTTCFNRKNAESLIELVADKITESKIFEPGEMPFEDLPPDVQESARGTLRAYDEVNVEYEYGRWIASASYGICAEYNWDHYVAGFYKAKDIYTPEQRRQNFIEEFGYAPTHF